VGAASVALPILGAWLRSEFFVRETFDVSAEGPNSGCLAAVAMVDEPDGRVQWRILEGEDGDRWPETLGDRGPPLLFCTNAAPTADTGAAYPTGTANLVVCLCHT
jgi:hypothetical protein